VGRLFLDGPGGIDMATATVSTPVETHSEEYVLLHGVRWSTYEALLEDLEGCRTRLTYDDGSLEIMTISPRHEWSKSLIRRMIEALTEELNIPIRSGGSTTFRKQLKKKGLEPDECYWIANEPLVRGRADLDLQVDPPPDLAVEVEITRSALNRMGIYAALGVSEIWRSNGDQIMISQLQDDGTYASVDHSPSFPWLPLAELGRFLEASATMNETRWIRSFRAWVRAEVAPLAPEFDEQQ
jgi:Uma2 family endonuclease